MAQLFQRDWTRRELERFGNLPQFAGLKRYRLQDGFERDVEIIEIESGAGLRVGISPSRGMDIVWARYKEMNLCWRGNNGTAHPAFYEENNFGWLRGFPGGMVTTCGLSSFGSPCEDEGEYYGQHDRFSYTPAEEVSTRTLWKTETECVFEASARLRQTRLFGPNLRLERRISIPLGENTLTLHDRLTNDGFTPSPAVILYHCNFGYPLVAPGAAVEIPSRGVRPHDENAAGGIEHWARIEEPSPVRPEEVFFHDLNTDDSGQAYAGIYNPEFEMRLRYTFNTAQLPHLTQWKLMASGQYVMGLEPSNVPLMPRSKLRENGLLPILEPGESREFEIEFEVDSLFV